MAHLGTARRPGAGGQREGAWVGVARAARGTTERPSPARWPGTSATGVPGPEGALRGGSRQGASRPAVAPPHLHPSARAWEHRVLGPRRCSPRRRVLLLSGRPPGAVTELAPAPAPSPLSERYAGPGPRGEAPRLPRPDAPGNLRPGPRGLDARVRSRSGM